MLTKTLISFVAYIYYLAGHCAVQAQIEFPQDVDQSVMMRYVNMIQQCGQTYPVSQQDIYQLKNKVMPENVNAKCFLACFFKMTGTMNEQGYFSGEGYQTATAWVTNNNPTHMQNAVIFTQACGKVNNEPVSDGTAGCERAALLYKCTIEVSPETSVF